MTNLEKNLCRLFGNNERLFLVALDHPQFFGLLPGLEDTIETAKMLLNSALDGFIFNAGIFERLEAKGFASKILIARASVGGSKFGQFTGNHPVYLSARRALEIGADGVIVMMIVGGNDVESIRSVGESIEKFHSYGLPVIVEILAHDPSRSSDPELTATGARIASELGADVIKVFYTDRFEKVVEAASVPVILAGGPKTETIEAVARKAVESGVKGFAFGRNIFTSPNPVQIVERLERILRG